MTKSFEYAPEAMDLSPQESMALASIARLSQQDGLGVGLTGAHRTGKTSIVKRLAEKNPAYPLVSSSASALAAKHGFDMNAANTLGDRIAFQEIVLEHFASEYAAQPGMFFSDRTPLDLAAYMLADVRAGAIDPEHDARIKSYVDRCVEVTNRHFALVVVIQPGIPYKAEEGKPALNVAYQEAVGSLIAGLGITRVTRSFYIMGRDITDLQKRVNHVAEMTTGVLTTYYRHLQNLPRQ